MTLQQTAADILREWRGAAYSFGPGVLAETGRHAAALGQRAMLIANQSAWMAPNLEAILEALAAAGVDVIAGQPVPGAAANAPRSDVERLSAEILDHRPEMVVAVGGGSTIDAAKAALVLAALRVAGGRGAGLDDLFGTGQVTRLLAVGGSALTPLVAVQTAASSAAHLTKYSNVTDPVAAQKKVIVDDAIVPPQAVFDYDLTRMSPRALTLDGAFDGIAHCLEVFWSPATTDDRDRAITTGLELLVKYLPAVARDPGDLESREALGLGTDLGGYAIMVGGTSGPHLNSFSLVDVASHGRACAILNPYYTAFFAPAIKERVRAVGRIYRRYGHIDVDIDLDSLGGRELGIAVAGGMIALSRSVGYPVTLGELPGFGPGHVERMLAAAKDPQLAMKLRNMPVPLDTAQVDRYLGGVLASAVSGDLALIPAVEGGA